MKNRPRLTLCAAVTADGKLDASARQEDFPRQPGDVWFELATREDPVKRLRELRTQEGNRRVICCGGPKVFRRLFDEKLVAEIYLLIRPRIDGRRGAATLSGAPGEFFPASIRCRLLKIEARGNACFLHYRVLRSHQTSLTRAETSRQAAKPQRKRQTGEG